MLNENVVKAVTLIAGEDLEPERLVKLSGTRTVSYADAGEANKACFMTMERKSSGQIISCKPLVAGVWKATAKEAFSVNTVLYCGDDGKVQDTSSGTAIARSIDAATADDDSIDVVLFPVTQA